MSSYLTSFKYLDILLTADTNLPVNPVNVPSPDPVTVVEGSLPVNFSNSSMFPSNPASTYIQKIQMQNPTLSNQIFIFKKWTTHFG